MTLEEQLNRIIYKDKEKELIPFFKSLTPEDRKSLVPQIKKLHKELSEAREVRTSSSISFQTKGSQKQIHNLGVASFICFNRKEFEKLNQQP